MHVCSATIFGLMMKMFLSLEINFKLKMLFHNWVLWFHKSFKIKPTLVIMILRWLTL